MPIKSFGTMPKGWKAMRQFENSARHWIFLLHAENLDAAPMSRTPKRVLTARCGVWCDVSQAGTQYMLTLKVAVTWPVCTVCNGWVMLLACMGKTHFGGIIWGEGLMMHAQKFSIQCIFSPQITRP